MVGLKKANPSLLVKSLSAGGLLVLLLASCSSPDELLLFELEREIQLDNEILLENAFHLTVGSDGQMVVVDQNLPAVLLYDREGRLVADLNPERCHPGFNFRPFGNVAIGSDFIFLNNSRPWGYVFVSNRIPAKDLPEGGGPEMMKAIGPLFKSTTFNNRIDMLTDDLLFLQFTETGAGATWVVADQEDLSVNWSMEPDFRFDFVREGRGYRFILPDLEDPDAEPTNPRIGVYRYIGPGSN